MLHTSWVYQSKNSDKWLVLGYKTDVLCDIIKNRKQDFESFCNREYNAVSITDDFLYAVFNGTDFKDIILKYCNYFVLIYVIEEDEKDILSNTLNPAKLSLVSGLDYEESIDKTKNIEKLDETKVKHWYTKNQLLYQYLFDYVNDTAVDKMILNYTKSTKEQFQSAKKYYLRYAFEKFYKETKRLRIVKSSDEIYTIDIKNHKIYGICDKKASKEQKVISYLFTLRYQYYNASDVSYIKDYVPKQIDKMVEKYEDL